LPQGANKRLGLPKLMAIPIYINVISGIFSQIHHLLDQYVHQGYVALAEALKYPLGISVTLYIVLLGYSITQGWVKYSISEFVKTALKIGLIYTFAMNWDFFSTNVVGFIQEGSNQLGGIIFYANNHASIHNGNNGIESALQSILVQFTKLGLWFWKRGSLYSPGPYLEGTVVWASGIALLLIATFQLILANIMLAILFVAAPLFVGFALFEPTQGLFDRWLGNIVGFALLILFVSIVLGFVLSIAHWAISGINEKNLMQLSAVTFVPIVLVVFIGIGLIKRAASLAHEIGMGISTLSSSMKLANTVMNSTLRMGSKVILKNGLTSDSNAAEGMYAGIRSRLRRGDIG